MKNLLILSLLAYCFAFAWAGASPSGAPSNGGAVANNSSLAKQDDASIFAEANRIFDEANKMALKNPAQAKSLYQDAILKYQFLVDRGRGISPDLYANLANAYFFAGDHGRAVLYYHRALDLDPLRSEIRHNLRYVRSLTVDELPETNTEKVLHALTFWHRWPFEVRLTLFALGNVLAWAGIASLFYRRRRWVMWGVGGAAVLALVFGGSLCASYFGWGSRVDGVVIEREVVGRQGNGYIYDNAYTSSLHAGTEFDLIETRGGWYHVRLLDGSTCWLPKKSSALIR